MAGADRVDEGEVFVPDDPSDALGPPDAVDPPDAVADPGLVALDPPASEAPAYPTFAAWYEATSPRLVRAARLLVRDADVEDLVVDACVKLMTRWDRRRPENPTAWTLSVVVNASKRRGRLAARDRTRHELLAVPEHTDQALPDLDLEQAIRDLPHRQQVAVALRYGADLSQADTAAVMGIAPGTAAALLNQARTNLRKRLGDVDDH